MPFHDMKHDVQPRSLVNEIDRVVIVLPNDTSFYNTPLFIAVAFDANPQGIAPDIIGASRMNLPFLAGYQLFSRLCGDRAMRTVDGDLCVSGEVVTPERYLALWRTAIGQPLTPDELTDRYAYSVYAVLGGRLEGLRGQRSCWNSSPFETFDHFEAAYRERIDYLDDNRQFRVEFDLKQIHAARDVFYLESFLSSANQLQESRSSIELKPVALSQPHLATMPSAQPDLFSITEGAP